MPELPPNNENPEEKIDSNKRKEEIVPEGQEKFEIEIDGQLNQAETTSKEVEDLLANKEISDAEKEVARKKLIHIGDIVIAAVGTGTAIAANWGSATVSMMEKLGIGGKTVEDLMDFMSRPEVPEVALAGAVVGLVGALKMAFSSVNLDIAQDELRKSEK